jgi:hypothetical protein
MATDLPWHDMASTDDDVIASWHQRVGTLRKRERTGAAALAVVPAGEIDVRIGRPAAPERLLQAERAMGAVSSQPQAGMVRRRRGGLGKLRPTVSQVQSIEAALRKAKPDASERYQKLAHMHRQSVTLATLLATKLRLVPSTRLDARTPQDGDLPVKA